MTSIKSGLPSIPRAVAQTPASQVVGVKTPAAAVKGAVVSAPTPQQLGAEAKKQLESAKSHGSFGVMNALPEYWAKQEVGGLAKDLGLGAKESKRLTDVASGAGSRSAKAYEGFLAKPETAFTKNADGTFAASADYGAAHKVASSEGRKAVDSQLARLGLPSIDSSVAKFNALPKGKQEEFMKGLTEKLKNPAAAKFSGDEKTLSLAIGFARVTWASSQGPRALVGAAVQNPAELIRADPEKRPAYNFTGELIRKFGETAPAELFKDLEQMGAKWAS
jgi:hypothetical protein